MKILTKSRSDWEATLNVVMTELGRYRWEVELTETPMHARHACLRSEHDFASPTHAAVDGLRAMDGLDTKESEAILKAASGGWMH